MKRLYAPWRSDYVANTAQKKSRLVEGKDCVLCMALSQPDGEENFILYRGSRTAVIMNLYPYNTGHLMVIPQAHEEDLLVLPPDVRTELTEVLTLCLQILKDVLKPQGFNLGLNMGAASGAGIPSHLHYHILPRWDGDTNFLPLLAETKAISFDLKKTYAMLRVAFDRATQAG